MATADSSKTIHWPVVILCYGALFSLALIDSGRGPSYLAILQTFQLGPQGGSTFFALATLAGLIINLSAFYWLKAFPVLRSLKLALLIAVCASVGFSLAGTFHNVVALYLCSCCLGLGAAGLSVTMNVAVSRSVTLENRRRALAGLHSIYGLASLISPFILNGIYALNLDWRTFFIFPAILALPVLIWGLKIDLKPIENSTVPSSSIPEGQLPPLRLRLLYGMVLGFYVCSEVIISSRLAFYLETVRTFSATSARAYVGIFFGLLMLGRFTFGLLSLTGKSHRYLFYSLIATSICYVMAWKVHPIFFAFCGLTMSIYFPCTVAWFGEVFPAHQESMISLALTCVGFSLVVAHWMFGLVSMQFSVALAMFLSPIFSVLSASILLALSKHSSGSPS